MLDRDDEATAQAEQDGISDARMQFWFDGDKAASKAWSSETGLVGPAWDVYSVYGREAAWDDGERPPRPAIWMHQLDFEPGLKATDRLDARRLAREWLGLLKRQVDGADALAQSLHERGVAVAARGY
jgi:hypothetical protein